VLKRREYDGIVAVDENGVSGLETVEERTHRQG
jgi:hypothetical protein